MLRYLLIGAIVVFTQLARAESPSVFKVGDTGGTYTGTAFELQTKRGVVTVTNRHICKDQTTLVGIFPDKSRILIVKSVSEKHDLCILTSIPGMPSLKAGADYHKDEKVTVEGYPRGVRTLTKGTIGLYYKAGILDDAVVVQYLGKVYHGSSGSPVLDPNGDVVGVIALVSSDYSYGGIVPLEFLKDFIDIQPQ